MPKLFPPSVLESPEARTFCLEKQITDTGSLRHHLRESVCLGIDVEGCEGIRDGVTSIGLAVLPPTDFLSSGLPSPPFETQEFVERYHIESYCFQVEGRSRRKPFPPFPFGFTVKTAEPGRKMKAVVDSIKHRYDGKDIVLIGWHPHPREFPAIQMLAPGLFQEFVGWVDVVDVTRQLCVSKQEDLAKSWPPLSDVMISVGFSESCLPQRFCHSAGDDAIHTIIVLTRLLTGKPDGPPIEVRRQRPLKESQQRQHPDSKEKNREGEKNKETKIGKGEKKIRRENRKEEQKGGAEGGPSLRHRTNYTLIESPVNVRPPRPQGLLVMRCMRTRSGGNQDVAAVPAVPEPQHADSGDDGFEPQSDSDSDSSGNDDRGAG